MSLSMRVPLGVVLLVALTVAFAPHAAVAAQVNVSMTGSVFTPSNITINLGDSVTWSNTDTVAHTVTANNGSFESGTMQPGQAYSRTFTSAGAYSYHCTFHSGMVGTITVVSTLTSGAVGAPTDASALRAQAQALLARVQQLQAQLGASGGGSAGVAIDSSSCPLIGRSLKRGVSGDDVKRLQQFLARDSSIYPEGLASGYYGALTEAAVKRWQAKYNIVSSGTPESTGYGVVGPRTAAAISLLCTTGSYGGIPSGGSTGPVGGFIQVTPISGNAPLTVAIQATVNTVNSCTGATYTLDYGDGTPPAQIAVPVGNCAQMTQTLGHAYQWGGVYSVTLSAGAHRTSATVQVFGAGPPVVGGPVPSPTPSPTPPPQSSWVIVAVALSVGGNPLAVSVEIEYPAGSAYRIDWGDSTSPSSGGGSSGGGSATVNHTYGGAGTYIISLKDGGGAVKATSAVSISN